MTTGIVLCDEVRNTLLDDSLILTMSRDVVKSLSLCNTSSGISCRCHHWWPYVSFQGTELDDVSAAVCEMIVSQFGSAS